MYIKQNGVLRKMTDEELLEYQEEIKISTEEHIEILKENLNNTDYKTIKEITKIVGKIGNALQKLGVDNIISDEFIIQENTRQQWRDKINQLEDSAEDNNTENISNNHNLTESEESEIYG